MKKYRIIQNIKNDDYHIQEQVDFIFFKKWISLHEPGVIFNAHPYTNKYFWFLIFGALVLGILLTCLSNNNVYVIYDVIVLGCLMLFCLDGFDGHFNKKCFNTVTDAKNEIDEIEETNKYNSEIKEKLKKNGKNKVVSVYINGEHIDGEQLKRWKKLERVINESKDPTLK
jgi:hypothetical protein